MNQTFEFRRWSMLVAGHWAENRKSYLLALLAMGGLLTAWYGFLLSMDKFGPVNLFIQYATYYIGIFFVGCFYASTIFAELSNKSRAIQYLSLPASHLEKLLCGILFGVVFFFLAYTILFYLVDIPMVSLANRIVAREHQHWPGTFQPVGNIEVLNLISNQWAPIADKKFHILLAGYFMVQSAFLLGSVYFARWSFIKTVVAILLFQVVFVLFMSKGLEDHMPEGWHTYNFFRWIDNTDNTVFYHMVTLPGSMENIILRLFQFSLPPIFWVITYFRLKEKEV